MVIAVGLAGFGKQYLVPTNSYRIWFSPDNPDLLAFDKMQDVYTKADSIFFVVAPKDGNVFTKETLNSIEWLTKESWQIPHSTRVDSVTNYQHTYARGDELIVSDLVKGSMKLEQADLDRIKSIAMTEPATFKNVVSEKGHVSAVNVMG